VRKIMKLGRLPVGYVDAGRFGGFEYEIGLLITGNARSVVAIYKKKVFAELAKHYSHFMEREDSLVFT
jgi:hypothetical protein